MGRFSKSLATCFALALAMALMVPFAAFGDQLEAGSLSDLASESTQVAVLQTQANDTFASAMAISINSGVSDALADSSDDDWYRFTLSSAGRLDLKLSTLSAASYGYWWVYLYDASKNELARGSYSLGGTATQTISTIGLPAGTYYVLIDYGSSVQNVVYTLTPSFASSAYWETELNGSLASADAISVNAGYSGAMSDSSDDDWYRFTLSSAGRLDLKLSTLSAASYGYWWVYLYDASKNELARGSYSLGGNASQTIATKQLPTGTYYVLVDYGSSVQNVVYTLTPSFTQTHSIAQASYVGISNRTYTGKAIQPVPTVKYGSVTLRKGVDYTLSYSNNVNVGTATISVNGMGAYTGTLTAKFKIVKRANPMKASGKTITVKFKTLKKKSVSFARGKAFGISKAQGVVTFKKVSGNGKIAVSKAGKVTVKKGLKKGTYTVKVKVTAKGNANNKSATKTVTFKVRVK